ncbi:NUDIX hydrolase [Rhizobium sp. TRM95111]|uniref:NUDIX hydrolase n=1 Tax=Rhizobium alarense TaxID=2846851 RepID=UPI001F1ECB07|nr:NUDIX hydrolase [Rhizobium alarense]MCF3640527.1 NUDIX hydrolase [Rhizobium alarense]
MIDAPADDPFAGWPAEGQVFPLAGLAIRLAAGPHPFHAAEHVAAAANWQAEIAANPALFNGDMLLIDAPVLAAGVLAANAHVTPYATFLLWRRRQPDCKGFHLFGLPLVVSSDGALIAVRMSRHTANPGKVYCAAGSLEPNDVADGRVDLFANMAREVHEEIGLVLADARADATVHAVRVDRAVTVLRVYRFGSTADELLAGIATHILHAEEQEIDQALAIRDARPDAFAYPAFMPPVLAWFFDREKR